MPIKKIAFFASGSGSNFENIVLYLNEKGYDFLYLIFCNKPDAYVLERAKKLQIKSIVFDKTDFKENDSILNQLIHFQPDLIVLAGFLWLMPKNIIQEFPNRIINIHPALLPAYGGKGMYGMKVHEAVVENKEKQSGITIHYVNEHYDEGIYIFQESCTLTVHDTAEDVADKVHALEYEHYPKVIERFLLN